MRRLFPVTLLAFIAACGDDAVPTAPTAENFIDAADTAAVDIQLVGPSGAVYIASNAAEGNAVLVFPRRADGGLEAPTSFATGGLGTGAGLGNQGGIALGVGGQTLYVVNAGSDEISAFRVLGQELQLLETVPSGGDLPISITRYGRLLYVLHDGAPANLTGFFILPHGELRPIPGSTRGLSTATPDAAEIGFSPDGAFLVVTEKATNRLVSWRVRQDGLLSDRAIVPSAGQTPFGFSFAGPDLLLVSEAFGGAPDASTVSSYGPGASGFSAINPVVPTTETAACWLVVTPDHRFAYVTNTGSASVSGFSLQHGGLELLNQDGVTGTTGATPIDAGISRNGRFLYTLNGGAQSISAFRIGADGSLESLGETGGLPAGANGLVAE